VDVLALEFGDFGEGGEGEVVGGDRAYGACRGEGTEDGFGGGFAVEGVGSREDFVDEEEGLSGVGAGLLDEGFEAFDFGEELGFALGEGVSDDDGSAEVEGGQPEGFGRDRSAGKSEDGVDADGAEEGGFAGHVGAGDEEELRVGVEGDVVGDGGGSGEEWVGEGFGGEVGGWGGDSRSLHCAALRSR
jgi:hypothetical protein